MNTFKKISPLITAIAGFSLAWLIKPVNQNNEQDRIVDNHQPRAPQTANKITIPAGKALSSKAKQPITDHELAPDLPPQLLEAMNRKRDSLDQAFMLKDQGFVQRMAELLTLSTEQQNSLMQLLNQKRESGSLFASFNKSPDELLETAEKAESVFHDGLSQLLNSSQIQQYNQYLKIKAENRSLANAQTSYADILQKVDLSPSQQSAVQAALQDVAKKNQATSDPSHIFHEMYETLGYGVAATSMAIASANEAKLNSEVNREKYVSEIAHQRQRETTEKLESLRHILTPAQWEQYRMILHANDQTFYNSLSQNLNRSSIDPKALNPNVEN